MNLEICERRIPLESVSQFFYIGDVVVMVVTVTVTVAGIAVVV
jgi:hypothetical protein